MRPLRFSGPGVVPSRGRADAILLGLDFLDDLGLSIGFGDSQVRPHDLPPARFALRPACSPPLRTIERIATSDASYVSFGSRR